MTTIGMGAMILGGLIFAIGWNGSPKKTKLLGCGALLMAAGMCIGIGGNPARDMPNGSPPLVVLGFLLLIVGVVLLVPQITAAKKTKKVQAVQAVDNKKIAFYHACVQKGVTDCRSEKDIQRAELIAQQYGLLGGDVKKLFDEARMLVDKDAVMKEQAALEEKKSEERLYAAELEQYGSLSGRSKRIAYLSDKRAEELSAAKTLRDGANAVMKASQQKEHDWALLGGIADGIAGPGAGVATALDYQAKNEQIRAQNKANLQAMAPVMMTSYSGALDHERRADRLQEEIENTKTKLLGKEDAAASLSYLSFDQTEVEISETGTCTVTTTASMKKPLYIFDDVKAVVDGTVLAKIYDGKELVGVAKMVLPPYGIEKKETLKGVCLFCGEAGKHYTAEFAAVNLWTMER